MSAASDPSAVPSTRPYTNDTGGVELDETMDAAGCRAETPPVIAYTSKAVTYMMARPAVTPPRSGHDAVTGIPFRS